MSRPVGSKRGVWSHGRYSTYNKRGCRCEECCAARDSHHETVRSQYRGDNIKTHAGKTRLYWREYAAKQGCQVCGSFERLCIDHDHSCCPGKHGCEKCVRGVLCNDCNTILGRARDNPDRLHALAVYLEESCE